MASSVRHSQGPVQDAIDGRSRAGRFLRAAQVQREWVVVWIFLFPIYSISTDLKYTYTLSVCVWWRMDLRQLPRNIILRAQPLAAFL